MACILQPPTEGRAQGVIPFRPVPAVELTGAFAAKQNDGLHGVGRVRISCLVFTAALDALPLSCNQAASLISPYIWARNRARAR